MLCAVLNQPVEITAASHINQMEAIMDTDQEYDRAAALAVQQFAIAMRWAEGDSGRMRQVREALKNTIEGVRQRSIELPCCGESITVDDSALGALLWTPSWWFRGYQCQIKTAEANWPDAVLPAPPKVFRPQTKSEVPLGFVPDTFDSSWNKAGIPRGYTKFRSRDLKSDPANLRLAPNKVEFAEPVWLAFDPEHGKGESPDSFWGQADLAASEVFSALTQFPDWPFAWFNGASAPNLTGYQLKYDTDWSRVPHLSRWGGGRQLKLTATGLTAGAHWSSPSVREC